MGFPKRVDLERSEGATTRVLEGYCGTEALSLKN